MKKLLSLSLAAVMLFSCALPFYAFADAEEPHVHSLSPVAKVSPTCEADGVAAHYECSGCELLFANENTDSVITADALVIPKTGHSPAAVDEVPSTCKDNGVAAHYACTACGKLFSDENGENAVTAEELALPLGEHNLVYVNAVKETCTKNGCNAHYKCTVCGRLFKDAAAERETNIANETVKYHDHKLAFKDSVAATFTKNGLTEGAYCTECNKVIVPQKTVKKYGAPKLTNLKSAKRKITASWKEVSGVDGYVIQVSLKKNFKKKKSVTVKDGETVKKTVSKLKRHRRYYVRVRAYKKIDGEKKYSKWSNVKRIKTK